MTRIRLATGGDAEQIAAIYAPIVRDTAISFEYEPPTADEIRNRIETTLRLYPWLVGDAGGAVEGYAYAGQHSARAAYQWSVNVSVYIHEDHRGRGIGRALYAALFEILRGQGLFNAYAGITLPNSASVGLHESVGFTPVGVYRAVGFKLGQWHDVGWWELALATGTEGPQAAPLALPEMAAGGCVPAALERGNQLLEG